MLNRPDTPNQNLDSTAKAYAAQVELIELLGQKEFLAFVNEFTGIYEELKERSAPISEFCAEIRQPISLPYLILAIMRARKDYSPKVWVAVSAYVESVLAVAK